MQVGGASEISPSLVHVDEISREAVSEGGVVAAAAPLPISGTWRAGWARTRTCGGGACRPLSAPAPTPCPLAALWSREFVSLTARARIDGAAATGTGDGVRQSSACNGVDERSLPTACSTHTQLAIKHVTTQHYFLHQQSEIII